MQDRGQQPQVGRHRRLQRERIEDAALDVHVHPVDLVVVGDHLDGERVVLADQRAHGAAHHDLDAFAGAKDLFLQRRKLLVEPAPNLAAHPNRPVT